MEEVSLNEIAGELPRMCCVCGNAATTTTPTKFGWGKLIFPKVHWRFVDADLGACEQHASVVQGAAKRIATRFKLSRFAPVVALFAGFFLTFMLSIMNRPSIEDSFAGVPFEPAIPRWLVFVPVVLGFAALFALARVLRAPVRQTVWFSGTFDQPKVGFDGKEISALLSGDASHLR